MKIMQIPRTMWMTVVIVTMMNMLKEVKVCIKLLQCSTVPANTKI